ncbi:MAG: nucleoside triphosphate pyrophosphohydrolase [Deltaproteobacteria bacterium]|nr:nucleoside triphosphate pyrophosphohydrolase [Deltaproteobacteria bacterium]
MSDPRAQTGEALKDLVALMDRLLAPDGCPWDREQTLETLRPPLIEETYEVLDTMADPSPGAAAHCEELGDLMLQIVFQAALRAREGKFGIDDVCRAIVAKLVRRHPHVFGDARVKDADEVLAQWTRIKAREQAHGGEGKGVLEGVPRGMPQLVRAFRLTDKAARVGFDWPDVDGPRAKVDEELAELDRARAELGQAAALAELGDLLFALVNLARHEGLDPEEALRGANERFIARFGYIERRLREQGRDLQATGLAEMDALWDEAKQAIG